MKLAEALILRADYQKRMGHLQNRLMHNAKVQEEQTPAEDPTALLAEVEEVCAAHSIVTPPHCTSHRYNQSANLSKQRGGDRRFLRLSLIYKLLRGSLHSLKLFLRLVVPVPM